MDIYSRQVWGSKHGKSWKPNMPSVVDTVFLHTIAVDYTETSFQASARHLLSIENFHVNTRRWTGIGYSWLIDTEGRIFEGRGLRVSGGHTQGHNSTAYGVAFFGHGDNQAATPGQIASFGTLLRYLVQQEKVLSKDYRIRGHREVSTKSCPGNLIWPLVQSGKWSPENILNVRSPEPEKENELLMASVSHLYLEAFGRYGGADEIAYWAEEIAKGGRDAAEHLTIHSAEAKQYADHAIWLERVTTTLGGKSLKPELLGYLKSELMGRAAVVDTLLILSLAEKMIGAQIPPSPAPTPPKPPPVPAPPVVIAPDKTFILRTVAEALNQAI